MGLTNAIGFPWTSDRPVAEAFTCDNTQNLREKNIYATNVIRTLDPSNRAVVDLRFRRVGHRDWLVHFSFNPQVHSLFQSEFSTQCDLVLPLSIFTILSFSKGSCLRFLLSVSVTSVSLHSSYSRCYESN
jgi:hypothetical protein